MSNNDRNSNAKMTPCVICDVSASRSIRNRHQSGSRITSSERGSQVASLPLHPLLTPTTIFRPFPLPYSATGIDNVIRHGHCDENERVASLLQTLDEVDLVLQAADLLSYPHERKSGIDTPQDTIPPGNKKNQGLGKRHQQ